MPLYNADFIDPWKTTVRKISANISLFVGKSNARSRIYPTHVRKSGWYNLPGYNYNSPEIVFSGSRYLVHHMVIRIWYGEDLYGWTEWDNHGYTCMDVYIYT